jgi:hypothetical protein
LTVNVSLTTVKLGNTYDQKKLGTATGIIRTNNVTSKTSPIGIFKPVSNLNIEVFNKLDIPATMQARVLSVGFQKCDEYNVLKDHELLFAGARCRLVSQFFFFAY